MCMNQFYVKHILALFGSAICISLQRTMGKYLKSTGGVFCNDMRDEWELEAVSKLLSHNNFAERPFAIAIAKAYLTCFPAQKLSTLATFSQAIANGSHRPAGTQGKCHKTKQRIR